MASSHSIPRPPPPLQHVHYQLKNASHFAQTHLAVFPPTAVKAEAWGRLEADVEATEVTRVRQPRDATERAGSNTLPSREFSGFSTE